MDEKSALQALFGTLKTFCRIICLDIKNGNYEEAVAKLESMISILDIAMREEGHELR